MIIHRLLNWRIGIFSPLTIFVWLVGLGFGCLTATVAYVSVQPTTFSSVREDDGLAQRGGRAVVLYHASKTLDCPSSVSRFLSSVESSADPVTGPIYDPISTSSSPPVSTGVVAYGVILHVPPDTAAGDYNYVTKTQYYFPCNILHPWPHVAKPVRIRVVASGPDHTPEVVVVPQGQDVLLKREEP